MEGTADHFFNPKSASPALKAAVTELATKLGRSESDFAGARLGDLFDQALAAFGGDLPDFWRVWNSWNQASDAPAEWGDL